MNNPCPDEGCIALRHVLETVTEVKDVSKRLVTGQQELNVTLSVLNANVINMKTMGERLGKLETRQSILEKNQWKMVGAYSILVPIATGLVLQFFK